MALYTLEREPALHNPVLVMALEGWIDAGFGAANAMSALLANLDTEVVATFDGDALLDFRSRRPSMRIVDGMNTGLTWPETRLLAAGTHQERDLLLLVGPEPDHHWRTFTAEVVSLTEQLGARLAIGFGAFPAPAPHTRPVRLTATATTADLARQIGFMPGAMDVPSGIHGALERGFALADIPCAGIWARVPHYVSAMAYPAASAALLEGLAKVSGITFDTTELAAAAEATRQRVDELVSQNPEHAEMVRGLEQQEDSHHAGEPLTIDNMPSGDELAAELQKFLRGETG